MEIYSKLERTKFFLKHFFEVYEPICVFCGQKLDYKTFYPKLSGHNRDNLVEHHINHIHEDNRPKNRCLVHRDCHKRHHREEVLFKERNPHKKFSYKLYIKEQSKVKQIIVRIK